VIVELNATGGDDAMLFDVADPAGRKIAVERGADVVVAQRGLEQALEQARRNAGALLQIVTAHDVDEAELRFGLRLTGEAGLFAITKIGAEAHCEIVLKWKRRPAEEPE
jgi:hypothetical protein